MPTTEELNAFREMVEYAEKRAGTEVEAWIPEEPGDAVSGIVVEVGTLTTPYGTCFTTTLENIATGKNYRVGWMGAVLESSYLRLRPQPDDIVAMEFQRMVTPKTVGFNDYKLVVAVVIDPRTGKSKMPVDLTVRQVTEEDIQNADAATGEIAGGSLPKVGESPLTPRDGEEPFQ